VYLLETEVMMIGAASSAKRNYQIAALNIVVALANLLPNHYALSNPCFGTFWDLTFAIHSVNVSLALLSLPVSVTASSKMINYNIKSLIDNC
jgi:hypothetical protein